MSIGVKNTVNYIPVQRSKIHPNSKKKGLLVQHIYFYLFTLVLKRSMSTFLTLVKTGPVSTFLTHSGRTYVYWSIIDQNYRIWYQITMKSLFSVKKIKLNYLQVILLVWTFRKSTGKMIEEKDLTAMIFSLSLIWYKIISKLYSIYSRLKMIK